MDKVFKDGSWRLVATDGSVGPKCDPPSDAERVEQETQEQRRKYQTQADDTGKEVWWRGEKFLPSTRPGALKAGEKCPYCGAEQEYATNKHCHKCRADFMPAEPEPSASAPKSGTRQYKVVTQRDEFFGGKFDPQKLEWLVNTLAPDGWRVIAVATADVSTFWGSFWAGRGARQEMVVFLERTEP